MRRASDMALPERPPGVHEYRAALMSVFLNTLPQDNPLRLLIPSVQPLPLTEATQLIQALPGRYMRKAVAHATFKLALESYSHGRVAEFEPYLVALLGDAQVRQLRTALGYKEGTISLPDYEKVLDTVYATGTTATQTSDDTKQDSAPPSSQQTRSFALFKEVAAPLPQSGSTSTLDLETLTTTVRIHSPASLGFEQLASVLDPRSWSASPFWPECYEVALDGDTRQFDKFVSGTPIGQSWEGYLYEHVEWNWNTFSVSEFRNYLNIKFTVDPSAKTMDLRFSLYACQGSRLFFREASNGVDVDRGFQTVVSGSKAVPFRLDTQKNIRFSDILDRTSPLEGPVGSGQILSMLAPAVVGLWMHDLLGNLYLPES